MKRITWLLAASYLLVGLHIGAAAERPNVLFIPVDDLRTELVKHVRKEIGPIATPDVLQWAPGLPKTRSGKIMRRILRKIAENEPDKVGDTSTLAEPDVVRQLIENRMNR